MLKIDSPDFELHEIVNLHRGARIKGRITGRRYYLDLAFWEYQVSGGEYYLATSISSDKNK